MFRSSFSSNFLRTVLSVCCSHGECPSKETTSMFIRLCEHFIEKNPTELIGNYYVVSYSTRSCFYCLRMLWLRYVCHFGSESRHLFGKATPTVNSCFPYSACFVKLGCHFMCPELEEHRVFSGTRKQESIHLTPLFSYLMLLIFYFGICMLDSSVFCNHIQKQKLLLKPSLLLLR